MPKTSEDIKKITFNKKNDFFVRGERGKVKCILVQETDGYLYLKL